MRHNQSHKAQHTGNTDRNSCQQRRKENQYSTHPHHAHAKALRQLIAKLQCVQRTCAKNRTDNADCAIGQQHLDMSPAAPLKTAGHPHHSSLNAVAVKNVQRAHTAAEERRNRHACQNHTQGVNALLPREEKDNACGYYRADKGRHRHQRRLLRKKQHNNHSEQSCAGTHADNAGVGQRIMQNALQVAACQRQICAHEHRNYRARQTDEVHNTVSIRISLA